jgi:hypothetical protein
VAHTLGSRYRLSEYLSGGDTGEVWHAVDLGTDRAVAVKLLHRHLADDARLVDRLVRARAELTALWHPGIARLLDVIVDDGQVALVTDLVPGMDLRTRLARHGPLTPVEAADVGASMAEALGAAHRIGVVHGDIKPSNVVVPPAGAGPAKLTDFAVALLVRAGLRHTEPHLPARYRAPEVTDGAVPAPPSDVYALGVMLADMLAGAPRPSGPARGAAVEDPLTHLRHLASECVRADLSRRPTAVRVGRDLREILPRLRALERPNGDRPADGAAVPVVRPRQHEAPPAGDPAHGGSHRAVRAEPVRTVRAAIAGPPPAPARTPTAERYRRRRIQLAVALVAIAVTVFGTLAVVQALRDPAEDATGDGATSAGPSGGAASAGPVAATLPTGATTHNHDGGADFVRYWFAALNHAQQTGDTTDIAKATGPGCETCQSALTSIQNTYRGGGTLRGGTYLVRRVSTNRLWSLERPIYEATFDRNPRVIVDRAGREKPDLPEMAFAVCVVVLEWTGDRWRILDLPESGCVA